MSDSFITSEESWFDREKEISWAICSFNFEQYTQSNFNILNIAYPESMTQAVDKRQAEYLAGRYAAHLSLFHHGVRDDKPLRLKVSRHRYPEWPEGLIGSISHCADQAVCITARADKWTYVGVDVEVNLEGDIANKLSVKIHTQEELLLLTSSGIKENIATTLLFSAKESLYKALYPQIKCYFGFEAMRLIKFYPKERCMIFSSSQHLRGYRNILPYYQCQYELKVGKVLTYILGEKLNYWETLSLRAI